MPTSTLGLAWTPSTQGCFTTGTKKNQYVLQLLDTFFDQQSFVVELILIL
jgi:hypothetical protein